jgi:hypothetical protein
MNTLEQTIEFLRCAADGGFLAETDDELIGEMMCDPNFPSLVSAEAHLEPDEDVARLAFQTVEAIDSGYGSGDPETMRQLYLEAAMRLEETSA